MSAFRAQQFRWVKGAAQCLRKLAGRVWSSRRPLAVRLEAVAHLSVCLAYPAALVLLLASLPLIWFGDVPEVRPFALLSLGALGLPAAMLSAQYELYGHGRGGSGWWRRAAHIPLTLVLAAGLAANNARAAMEGLCNRSSVFERTPKGVTGRLGRHESHGYVLGLGPSVWLDVALAAYACAGVITAFQRDEWWLIPFLLLCGAGLCLVSALSLRESLAPASSARPAGPRA